MLLCILGEMAPVYNTTGSVKLKTPFLLAIRPGTEVLRKLATLREISVTLKEV